ncbi:MAG: hypothetical protein HY564_01670 [Candidatus Jacksonbacteria bacterium]|nr:hypothetical protein [Candidatus Jacksonbacteria bacterium]
MAGLHAGIDNVVGRMRDKKLEDDAALVAKTHDKLDQYVKYMRDWVATLRRNRSEEVTLNTLEHELGNPMVDGVEVARRNEGIDPKRMFTPEGEQELYEALGVLPKGKKVYDIPHLYAERMRAKGDAARAKVDPRDYVAVFPTNIEGVMLRIRKDLTRRPGTMADADAKKSPFENFENIELHFVGDKAWKDITGVEK